MFSPSQPAPTPGLPIASTHISVRAQLAASKLGLQGNPTKSQALRALGWVLPFDYILAFLIFSSWVTAGFYWLFGTPTAVRLIAIGVVDIFILQVWIIALVFRCSCFVLETQADINLMPEAAGRIAAAHLKGQRPSST